MIDLAFSVGAEPGATVSNNFGSNTLWQRAWGHVGATSRTTYFKHILMNIIPWFIYFIFIYRGHMSHFETPRSTGGAFLVIEIELEIGPSECNCPSHRWVWRLVIRSKMLDFDWYHNVQPVTEKTPIFSIYHTCLWSLRRIRVWILSMPGRPIVHFLPGPWLLSWRPMLHAFISSLAAFRDRSLAKSKSNVPRKSGTNREDALQSASNTSEKCHQANESRTKGTVSKASSLTQEGVHALTAR